MKTMTQDPLTHDQKTVIEAALAAAQIFVNVQGELQDLFYAKGFQSGVKLLADELGYSP